MPSSKLPRRAFGSLLLISLGLSACGPTDTPYVAYAPPTYDFLPKLRLNVATLDIDDSWSPRPETHDLGALAPIPPVSALRQMAQDRLVPGGNTGHGLFVIDDASLTQFRDRYEGRLTVHLELTGDNGAKGYAEARVTRTATVENDLPNASRAALNDLVSKMMSDMNVELEYQIRHSLRSYLQQGAPRAPLPAPVEQESLPPLPKA